MKRLILAVAFFFVTGMALAQEQTPQEACEAEEGYWKETPGACLSRIDMDADQMLIFRALKKTEQEKAQAVHTQQEFNQASVDARKANFDARIAALVVKRDAASGRPAEVYQEQIDKLTARRDWLDSDVPDPSSDSNNDPPRVKASQLGPVISQLSQEIGELKAELDASIP